MSDSLFLHRIDLLVIQLGVPLTDRIRMLNDELRRNLFGGAVTTGIAALGEKAIHRLQTIAIFRRFLHCQRPFDGHDFGALDFEGVAIMFKIEYYDKALGLRQSFGLSLA